MSQTNQKKNFLQWGAWVPFACSFSLLSFYLIIRFQKWYIIFTVALSFLFALFFIRKTWRENISYIKSHPGVSVLSLAVAVILVVAMHHTPGIPDIEKWQFSFYPFVLWLRIFTMPALFYLTVMLFDKASRFISELWSEMSSSEKRLYLLSATFLSAAVLILYATNSKWYTQFDVVYSIDSGYCSKSIFPKLYYYDIRHPAMSVITFPIWSIVRSLLQLFAPAQLLDVMCVACVQLINIQFLLLTGIMIGKLSKSQYVFPLWLVSLPMLLFSAFFEKYQICVFLLVLYVYRLCRKERGAEPYLIAAVGTMPTSVFLFADELLIKENIFQKLLRIGRTFAVGVMFLVCTGRIHLLVPRILLDEVSSMAQRFGLKSLSIRECLNSFTNLVHGAFLGISSENSAGKYIWTDVLGKISLLGVIIFVFMVLGVIVSRKEHFTRLCAVWTVSAFVLFVGFQWSVHASPLFSIYFAWAFIPLFQKGLQFVIEKLHLKEKAVYTVLITAIFALNLVNIIDISIFLK